MSRLHYTIAGYTICFENEEGSPPFSASPVYRNFTRELPSADITVRVRNEPATLPPSAIRVFNAPYMEESEGSVEEKAPESWSIWKDDRELFIRVLSRGPEKNGKALLSFSRETNHWDLSMEGLPPGTDPLLYPLDSLLLYYLTVFSGDIFIHASGVNHKGKGYLFSGISGSGKTTIASLWKDAGATVIHDDRIIIRRSARGWIMYNLPVYDDEQPLESPLDVICLIGHGTANSLGALSGSAAVTGVSANCIQHAWSSEIISGLLTSVNELCSSIPVFRYHFIPDSSAVGHLSDYERNK